MFRQFENIQITKDEITFIMVDGNEYTIHPKKEIDWMSEDHQALYGDEGETIFLGGRWLIIRKDGIEIKVYMHKEIRYTINKSIRTTTMFDLNYRKHIRSKFSRLHMDVYYMDGIDEEMSCPESCGSFEEAVAKIKNEAEEFSFGIESKPIVIIAPSWDTDNHILSYIIIKDEKVVKKGNY